MTAYIKCALKDRNCLKLPNDYDLLYYKYLKFIEQHRNCRGGNPSRSEIIDNLGISERKLYRLLTLYRPPLSLDSYGLKDRML